MATLTATELGKFLETLRRDPTAWTAQMLETPDKFKTLALFQGLENWFETNRAGIKAAMETEAGISITNALAKKYGKSWMAWKWGGE